MESLTRVDVVLWFPRGYKTDRSDYQGRELGSNGGGESGLRELHRWNMGFVYFKGTVKLRPGEVCLWMEIRLGTNSEPWIWGKVQLVCRVVLKKCVLCRWRYIDIKLSHLTNSEVSLAFFPLVSETSVWLNLSVWPWGHRNIRWHQYTIASHDDNLFIQFTVPRGDLGTRDCSSFAAQRTVESHDKLLQEHAKQEATQKPGKRRISFPSQSPRSLKGTSTMMFFLHWHE